MRGQEIFDATLFKDEKRTSCFYTFMAEMKSLIDDARPTETHSFINDLHQSKQLLRCYTQNIDCLEDNLDLPVIRLHGAMDNVKCILCSSVYTFSNDYEKQFREGEAPICPKCETVDSERTRLGKRQLAIGTLRPNIVLYNEEHPDGEAIGKAQMTDLKRRPDLMLVMGTSLQIVALKKFIRLAARTIHGHKHGKVILINRTPVAKEWDSHFDYQVMGDSDDWVARTRTFLNDPSPSVLDVAWSRVRSRDLMRDRIKKEEEDEKENVKQVKKATQAKTFGKASNKTKQTTLDGTLKVRVARAASTSRSKK